VSKNFILKSEYHPKGDQPKAIEKLVQGVNDGITDQVLLGVTGSGKTFTIANLINAVQKPTLILAHNKTCASQCVCLYLSMCVSLSVCVSLYVVH